MADATEWPAIPDAQPGEVIVSATDLTDNEVLYIKTISSESAQYIADLSDNMSDEVWLKIVSQIYSQSTDLIEEKTGIRVEFQFRIAPEDNAMKVRCFSFRRIH
jgi:two-component sensor histidine kinase